MKINVRRGVGEDQGRVHHIAPRERVSLEMVNGDQYSVEEVQYEDGCVGVELRCLVSTMEMELVSGNVIRLRPVRHD